jgi:hypothetical protein
MNHFLHTNVGIYRTIADEAYQKMVQSIETGRRRKPDGSAGWIITYDPDHTSFKQAMICLVFTGIWLEAVLHLLIVKAYGKDKFNEYDFKSYEEKLMLLGCTDEGLMNSVSRFRKARKALVHEKAHLDDGEIKWAQKEAENAHRLLTVISERFAEQMGQPLRAPDRQEKALASR